MTLYTNRSNIPLSVAVFLATDNYDYEPDVVSATQLLRPLRQLILSQRVPPGTAPVDLEERIASRMGQAIHDGIDQAWTNSYQDALRNLGYPSSLIERVQVNPSVVMPDTIPVYLEQQIYKNFNGYRISGRFDFLAEGQLEDFKTTSVFTWIHDTNDEKHAWQGSIYRWIDPQRITWNEMAIQYFFTDWSAAKAKVDPKYPQSRTLQRILPLKSVGETEAFVANKLRLLDQYKDAPEAALPACTDEDLWQREPVWKYYKNPTNTKRSTKNFDTYHDAHLRLIEDGSVGKIVEVPGQVTACKYCAAFSVCTQKDRLIASGDLIL